MPGATEQNVPLPIVDPTSATEEEIDPSIDRDRIRVVCPKIYMHLTPFAYVL
jgi:DNA-directed RNA polymerase I and III subunit RPAC2